MGGNEMPWSRGVVIEGTKWAMCSGATGRYPDRKQEYPELTEKTNWTTEDQVKIQVCPHSIEEQTKLVWQELKKNLEDLGTNIDNIFHIYWFLQHRYDWPIAWRTSREFWKQYAPELYKRPVNGTLIVEIGLDHPDMLIEIQVMAAVP